MFRFEIRNSRGLSCPRLFFLRREAPTPGGRKSVCVLFHIRNMPQRRRARRRRRAPHRSLGCSPPQVDETPGSNTRRPGGRVNWCPSTGAFPRPQSRRTLIRAHRLCGSPSGSTRVMALCLPGVALRYTPGYDVARFQRPEEWLFVHRGPNGIRPRHRTCCGKMPQPRADETPDCHVNTHQS